MAIPVRKLRHRLKRQILHFMSLWPPYLGAGVKVRGISPDYRRVEVEMKLHFWNQNYVGTHFGGSLYSMCDPFFALILMQNLGPDYIVWDKAASIRFRKPGKGVVRAIFEISAERLDELRSALRTETKIEPEFRVEIRDEQGEVVAEVTKLLYIRRKNS